MTRRRSLTTSLAALAMGVAAPLAFAGTAHAAPAAPSITPNPVAQDGSFIVAGAGCVDANGPGSVTLEITYPDGRVDTLDPDTAGDNGAWSQELAPEAGTVAAGSHQILAYCDLYEDGFEYPAATLLVKALPSDAPTISVDDAALVVNQKVTVSVSGFGGDEDLTAVLHSSPVTLGTMHTDLFGDASATFTIPAGTPAGTHTIVVTDAAGGSVQVTITVSNQTVTVVSSSKGGPTLADTGVDTAPYGVAAAALLLAGAGSLALGRRRTA